MWLTNCCPSVIWRCWLGDVTRKIISEMTYNVLCGTLNPTIPYHTIPKLNLPGTIRYHPELSGPLNREEMVTKTLVTRRCCCNNHKKYTDVMLESSTECPQDVEQVHNAKQKIEPCIILV